MAKKANPVTAFTKPFLKILVEQMTAALQPVGEKHGIKIGFGSGTFSPAEFTVKVKVTVLDTAVLEDEARKKWELNCFRYGLKPEDFGRTFGYDDEVFRVTGLNTRRRRMPISVERVSDGRKYKYPARLIKQLLAITDAEPKKKSRRASAA